MVTLNFIRQRNEYDEGTYGLAEHMVPLSVRINPQQWMIGGTWKVEGITGKSGQGYSTWHLYSPSKETRSLATRNISIPLGLLATDHNEYYWNVGKLVSESNPDYLRYNGAIVYYDGEPIWYGDYTTNLIWKTSYPNSSRGSIIIKIQDSKLSDTITILGITVKQIIAINGKT